MTVSPTRRVRAWAVFVLMMLSLSGAALAFASGAAAKQASTTVRLGMTGMVTSSAPNGTWSLHAHPGQTLNFVAGFVPGLDGLDVKQVLSVRVSMDAEHLPGGAHATVLKTNHPVGLTVRRPGAYPLHWTIAFVLAHGHKSTVEATRTFNAAIQVEGSVPATRPGVAGPGAGGATSISAGNPATASRNVVTTPHQSARPVGTAAVLPPVADPPTFTLPADPGAVHHANPGAIAALPLATAANTYVYTAIVGTALLGLLWLLWVASIKPILGR